MHSDLQSEQKITSVHKDIYTNKEILQILNERIRKHENKVLQEPSKARQLGDIIDELLVVSSMFS